MATISVRVEDDLKDRADEAAAGESLSISEWIRQVMRVQLGFEVSRWSAPTSMSKRDRLQLSLLHQILKAVSDDEYDVEYHETRLKVLEHGFAGEYSTEFQSIYDEMSLDECRLVWDILDMFRVIKASVDRLGPEVVRGLDDHAESFLQFSGFDFNDAREGRLADYAEHLVRNDRWTEFAENFDDKHERGNSHMPVLGSYLRMLDVFRPMWEELMSGIGRGRLHLNEDELLKIIQARYHPGRDRDVT